MESTKNPMDGNVKIDPASQEKPKDLLPVEAKIEEVLSRLRPYLAQEGGDIELARFDEETGVCYVSMNGACSGCSLAASDVSDTIEVMLMEEIPEITKVELVQDDKAPDVDSLIARLAAAAKAQQEAEDLRKRAEELSKNGNEPEESDSGKDGR
jgi:Fe-S cluster biogenesis protein NfuA